MSNQNVTDWLTWVPAGELRKTSAYITLPAFSVTNPTWKGASEIVYQFNFAASSNFYLLNRPTKPVGVNYGLCIRFRVGGTVYRYKLWTDDGFILNDDEAPLYNGQIIKKNFVLEVWDFNVATSNQATDIVMITSARSVPSDYRNMSNVSLAVGTAFSSFGNTNANMTSIPSADLICRWDAALGIVLSGTDVATWADQSGNSKTLTGGVTKPLYVAVNPGLLGKPSVKFNSVNAVLSNVSMSGTPDIFQFACVIRQNSFASGAQMIGLSLSSLLVSLQQFGTTPNIRIDDGFFASTVDNPNAALSDWVTLVYSYFNGVNSLGIYAIADGTQLGLIEYAGGQFPIDTIKVGIGGSAAQYDLAELAIYSAAINPLSFAAYFAYKYANNTALGMPLTFNPDGAWEDNTP